MAFWKVVTRHSQQIVSDSEGKEEVIPKDPSKHSIQPSERRVELDPIGYSAGSGVEDDGKF
jgi:hypothetical protein